jgi:hypothetical protein
MAEQRIFIGSSTEALGLAEAVHSELNEFGWISLWKNAFNPGDITIQRLCDIAQENEFGIFVFHPDDKAEIRGHDKLIVRDNVVLEAGIFMGTSGTKHTFIIAPKGIDVFRWPTDLAGLTVATYVADHLKRPGVNLKDVVLPAFNAIKGAIQSVISTTTTTTTTTTLPPTTGPVVCKVLSSLSDADKTAALARASLSFTRQVRVGPAHLTWPLKLDLSVYNTTGLEVFIMSQWFENSGVVQSAKATRALAGSTNRYNVTFHDGGEWRGVLGFRLSPDAAVKGYMPFDAAKVDDLKQALSKGQQVGRWILKCAPLMSPLQFTDYVAEV